MATAVFCFLFFGLLPSMAAHMPAAISDRSMVVIAGNLSKWENATVSSSRAISYAFSYNPQKFANRAIRVNATSGSATSRNPIIMVVRREMTVESWTIPELLRGIPFYKISRTLCPLWAERHWTNSSTAQFYIDLSTSSQDPLDVRLIAYEETEFTLRLSKPITFFVNPSSPMLFQYNFTSADEDAVMVKVTSDDDICAIVSVQEASCPVRVLPSDVQYRGQYQTMMTKSALTVKKKGLFANGAFFVVVVVSPDNAECEQGITNPIVSGHSFSRVKSDVTFEVLRQKKVSVVVDKALTTLGYVPGICMSLAVCLAFYGALLLVVRFFEQRLCGLSSQEGFEGSTQLFFDVSAGQDGESRTETTAIKSSRELETYNTSRYAIQDDYDNEEMSIISISEIIVRKGQAGENIVVSDLAQDDRKKTSHKYRQYSWTLLTVALFYGLPAVQLVFAYQLQLNRSGNEDICYYNFLCSHPAGVLSDFNHVWSNVGYGLLGILFFLIVFWRSRLYYRKLSELQNLGIPQYFGLYYAMAIGLFVEGFMSGVYHVCPNEANFQFDTSFMYVIAGMCVLRLYQSRHPDIEANAYRAFFAFGVIILLALCGVLYNSKAFWSVFFVLYMITIVCVNVEIYYMGEWSVVLKFIAGFCSKLRRHPLQVLKQDCLTCSWPYYKSRWFFLVMATTMNLGIAIWGIASFYPDFATYFLAIMISNLGMYFVYYFFMKVLVVNERPSIVTWTTAVLMVLCWVPAMYFFVQGLTNWHKSPAESRNGNTACIIFDFYDAHDVWHFLSAFALFFSFLTILTVDDDIMRQKRDTIRVF